MYLPEFLVYLVDGPDSNGIDRSVAVCDEGCTIDPDTLEWIAWTVHGIVSIDAVACYDLNNDRMVG